MSITSRPGDGDERTHARITDDDLAGTTPAPRSPGSAQCSIDSQDTASRTTITGFARGTRIATPSGDTRIEDLTPGDPVLTRDRGPQPLRWIGARRIKATGDFAPVMIRKGALGNDRDLLVGAGLRMLLCDWRAELMFGEPEVLATARHLVGDDAIGRHEGGNVELFHILFDNHEIMTANGALSESFHPGEHGLQWLAEDAREAVYRTFPQLRTEPQSYGPLARAALRGHEVRAIRR